MVETFRIEVFNEKKVKKSINKFSKSLEKLERRLQRLNEVNCWLRINLMDDRALKLIDHLFDKLSAINRTRYKVRISIPKSDLANLFNLNENLQRIDETLKSIKNRGSTLIQPPNLESNNGANPRPSKNAKSKDKNIFTTIKDVFSAIETVEKVVSTFEKGKKYIKDIRNKHSNSKKHTENNNKYQKVKKYENNSKSSFSGSSKKSKLSQVKTFFQNNKVVKGAVNLGSKAWKITKKSVPTVLQKGSGLAKKAGSYLNLASNIGEIISAGKGHRLETVKRILTKSDVKKHTENIKKYADNSKSIFSGSGSTKKSKFSQVKTFFQNNKVAKKVADFSSNAWNITKKSAPTIFQKGRGLIKKASPYLNIALNVGEVLSAGKGHRLEAIKKMAFESGGMAVGAEAGALAGSVFGPIGTLVGGIGGGILGSMGGDKLNSLRNIKRSNYQDVRTSYMPRSLNKVRENTLFSRMPVEVPNNKEKKVEVTVELKPEFKISTAVSAEQVLKIVKGNLNNLAEEVGGKIANSLERSWGNTVLDAK